MTYEAGARRLVDQLTTLVAAQTGGVPAQLTGHRLQHVAVEDGTTTADTRRHYHSSSPTQQPGADDGGLCVTSTWIIVCIANQISRLLLRTVDALWLDEDD